MLRYDCSEKLTYSGCNLELRELRGRLIRSLGSLRDMLRLSGCTTWLTMKASLVDNSSLAG
jgi:hypothetical protein